MLVVTVGVAAWAEDKADAVSVVIDTSGAPDLEPWAKESKALVESWYPTIAGLLKSEGFEPRGKVTLVFSDRLKGVAETSGARITISADWVRRHPEDKGMVIHELTHVIQSYPPSRDGWLVEGIADYVRFFRYEPGTTLKIRDPPKSQLPRRLPDLGRVPGMGRESVRAGRRGPAERGAPPRRLP